MQIGAEPGHRFGDHLRRIEEVVRALEHDQPVRALQGVESLFHLRSVLGRDALVRSAMHEQDRCGLWQFLGPGQCGTQSWTPMIRD